METQQFADIKGIFVSKKNQKTGQIFKSSLENVKNGKNKIF